VFLPDTDVDGKGCHRSYEAWPVIVWRSQLAGHAMRFAACSGATIDDYFSPNTSGVKNEPAQRNLLRNPQDANRIKLITLTFGGNDAGFADVVNFCVNIFAKRANSCLPGISRADGTLSYLARPGGGWPNRHTFADLYEDIRTAAPNARVLVVGYPKLFPTDPHRKGCGGGGGVHFSESEMLALNQTAAHANAIIEREARAAGFEYVDVEDEMNGHSVCSQSDHWINRALPHRAERQQSYHPNRAGQEAIAAEVIDCLQTPCDKPAKWLKAYAGHWSGRDRDLQIDRRGRAILLLDPCAGGCADKDKKKVELQLDKESDKVVARVVRSRAKYLDVGAVLPVTDLKAGVMVIGETDPFKGPYYLGFCRDGVADADVCP
jgi:hypothetical protein